jgi:hypothetical protein
MRGLALFLTSLLAATPAPPPAGPAPAPEPGIERWLWNARERTAAGLAALEAGGGEAAVGALETAARVAPADPRVRFNAGAGRLQALPSDTGDAGSGEQRQAAARAAIPHLQAAAAGAATAPLRTDALYDLGTAQLLAGEPAAAVDSLAEALRQDARREDAKYNLELALRALEEQQRHEQPPPQPEPSSAPQPEDGNERSDSAGPPPSHEPQSGPPPEAPRPPEDRERQPGAAPRGTDPQSPLPNFVDQPNLSAREAAALLEAVENRERQQRRESAAARAKERRGEEKDW